MKTKHFLLTALALLTAGTMYSQTYWNGTADKVFSGTGTQADPYLISTAEQLAGLAERTNTGKEDFAGKYIKLTADIYLTNYSDADTANWKQWEPIAHTLMQWGQETDYGYFRGTFDGDNHTIYNLHYGGGEGFGDDWDPNNWDSDLSNYDFSVMNKALFGNLEGATLLNIRVSDARMAAAANYQAILALNADKNTVIRNCHVQGTMLTSAAGLVNTNKGLIENCSANITTPHTGGGAFVAANDSTGIIRNCTSTGSMGGGGGFVHTNQGLIERCTADVDIYALFGPTGAVRNGVPVKDFSSGGGFVMYNDGGTIRECVAFGDLFSDGSSVNYIWGSGIAGFAYRNWGGRIESCYCTGALRDFSDSTGIGGNPTFAHFCYDNGYDAVHYNDDMARGDIINCYSTSTIYHHDPEYYKNNIHAFVASYHGYGGFYAELVEPSIQIGYFNQTGMPSITGQSEAVWNGIGKSLSEMQSQAFVDTLNLLASFMGTSQWELRDGLPRPTGVYQTNTTALFGGGDGTKANPYIIATKQHLENLRWLVQQGMTFKEKYFLQTADIALNVPFEQWEEEMPTQWKPIGSPRSNPWYSYTIPTEFDGVYDGGFHEVKNMYINNILDRQGLFGRLGKGVQLRNLGVTDAYIRSANHGVIAGEIVDKPVVIQCWTSGDVATQGQWPGSQGCLVGEMGSHGYVLNCASSVKMAGKHNMGSGIYDGAVFAGFHIGWASLDTLVNYLFTGNINNGGGADYGSFTHMENRFVDKEKANIESASDGTLYGQPNSTVDSTAWMQSKELVNIYNYSVARWNEAHAGNDTLQLHYWEWRDGDYPRVSPDASFRPPLTITFNSNGGAPVTTKYIYPDSEVLPPQRPLRNGYLFAGWYKDAALTQFFDWKTERPTSSITLYARWHEDKRFDIDVTPFQNEFTKTYHIKTAAQLRGFAAMQNGLWSWEDSVLTYNPNTSRYEYYNGNMQMTQAPMSFKGKKVVLDNDILLCDTTDWQYWGQGAFGLPWQPIGQYFLSNGTEGDKAFKGTFDGQGHTIYGMYIEKNGLPGTEGTRGLFAAVGDSAVIQRVGIAASVIDGNEYNTRGQSNDAVWYWREYGRGGQGIGPAGMLAATTTVTHVEQCYAEGIMRGVTDAANALIGSVENSWQLHNDTISDCYARVNIYDIHDNPIGLFAGSAWTTTYSHCYNAGVTKGGITNCTSYGTPINESTYFNKETGATASYCDGRGCTTNEMHAKATFVDWDFENIWGRNDTINDGYPYLRAFYESAPEDSEDPIVVTGITVQEAGTTISVVAGQQIQLHATVIPSNAVNKGIIYTSSDENHATIDENGLVTTHFVKSYEGYSSTVTITAKAFEGGYTQTCTISILHPTMYINRPIASKHKDETQWGGAYSNDRWYLSVNRQYIIYAVTTPDTIITPVTWSSSNESVASVTPLSQDSLYNGQRVAMAIVEAKAAGSVTISATNATGMNATYNWTVQYNALSSLTINGNNVMGVGETQQLTCSFGPYNASELPTAIIWQSDNTSVLSVSAEGLISAIGTGTANITAQIAGTSLTASFTITVSAIEATEITINEGGFWDTYELYEGETKQLTATILPENTTDKSVTWSSNNTSVATVDGNGLVIAVSVGTAQIGVTTANGVSAYTNILVKAVPVVEPESITINEATGSYILLEQGKTFQLTATVLPEDAADKSVTWSSDNPSVATVSATGLVTGVRAGDIATITARTSNGLEAYAYFEITEKAKVYYTIRFLNYDGTVLQSSQVEENTIPVYTGATPTRPEDEEYTYAFSGWSPAIVASTADADYTAVYTATAKPQTVYYTVTFMDWDGTELLVEQVEEGHDAKGPATNPTREGYVFTGWSKPLTNITSDLIVIAQYDQLPPEPIYYTIRFLNWDGTELLVEQVEEGHDAKGPATDPTREGYVFTGWSKPLTNITSNLIVIAQYDQLPPEPVYYTIRFLNWDGAVLQTSQVKEGDLPVYAGATPTKPEDEEYTYAFSGWSLGTQRFQPADNLPAATADVDYTATFTATAKPQPKDYTPQNLTVVSNTATSAGASVMLQWNMVQGVEMYELIVREGDNDILNVNTGFYTQYVFDLTSDNLPYGTHTLTWFVRSVVHYEPVSDYAEGPAFVVTIPQTEGVEDLRLDDLRGTKVLIDGVLYIVRPDGTMYNAYGARVK